jgi:hypothetical protein
MKVITDDHYWVRGQGEKGDPEASGRATALRALRKFAPDKVEEALREAQKSKNADIRAWARKELSK